MMMKCWILPSDSGKWVYCPFHRANADECRASGRGEVLSVIEIRQQIAEYYGLEPVEQETRLSDRQRRFRIPGARGELGFIGAVTKEFCARCNRIRLTPDGKLRGCLMADEVDFLKAMRDGASDEK